MPGVNLIVLYPYPADTQQFDSDYRQHIKLLHQKTNMPDDVHPYTIMRMAPGPQGNPPFYQMFIMPFPTAEALQQAMSTPEMQEVAADAFRISSGGGPVMLTGSEN